jgi:hypothetical protein
MRDQATDTFESPTPNFAALALGGLAVIIGAGFIIFRDLGTSALSTLAGMIPITFMLGGAIWYLVTRVYEPKVTEKTIESVDSELKLENIMLRSTVIHLSSRIEKLLAENALVRTSCDMQLAEKDSYINSLQAHQPIPLEESNLAELWTLFTLDGQSFMGSVRRQRRFMQVLSAQDIALVKYPVRPDEPLATRPGYKSDTVPIHDGAGAPGADTAFPPDVVAVCDERGDPVPVVHELPLKESASDTPGDTADPA